MRVLIDTNIFVDWLTAREPFAENSEKIIMHCAEGKAHGYLSAHTFPDLNYILRKQFTLSEKREIFTMLCNTFTVIAENKEILLEVFKNANYPDLEDGIQMECASAMELDCIVTRNIKDFKFSKIKALMPEEFLNF